MEESGETHADKDDKDEERALREKIGRMIAVCNFDPLTIRMTEHGTLVLTRAVTFDMSGEEYWGRRLAYLLDMLKHEHISSMTFAHRPLDERLDEDTIPDGIEISLRTPKKAKGASS